MKKANKNKRLVGLDVESYMPPKHGKAVLRGANEAVCYSFYDLESCEGDLLPAWTGEGARRALELLRDPDVEIVGHKIALFDLPVIIADAQRLGIEGMLDAVFEALAAGRIKDTMLAVMLSNLRRGDVACTPYDLGSCAKRYLGIDVVGKHGPDSWRKRYGELDGVPLDLWPEAAYDYAKLDAEYTAKVWDAMNAPGRRRAYTGDLPLQVCASFGLGLMACHGLTVDGDWAGALWDHFSAEKAKYARELTRLGIIRADKGTMDTAALAAVFEEAWVDRLGYVPPEHRTAKTQKVSSNADARAALEDLYPGDEGAPEAFAYYAKYNRASSSLSTWLAPIMDAAEAGYSLHPSYQGLLNTGRVSASKPSLLNIPGRLRGDDFERRALDPDCLVPMQIRGAFVPRPGHVFIACDYAALEMVTLAQVLCNLAGAPTALGKAINGGMDLHTFVASKILGISYEEGMALKTAGDETFLRYRGLSKIVNFSGPVGAATSTLSGQARVSSGIFVEVSEMDRVVDAWHLAWPEMKSIYTPWVSSMRDFDGSYRGVCHPPRGREGWKNRNRGLPWRRRLCESATVAANMPFQALAADGAKYVLWQLVKSCYYSTDSPIYGARLPLFIHDEFVLEVEAERAKEAQVELERVMVEGMRMFTPDIEVTVESKILTERWAK